MRKLILFALTVALCAQQQPQKPVDDAPATIKVDVNVVNILASVRDKKGTLMPHLEKPDLNILEDGKPQTIKYFTRETDLPLTIGMLVDTSGSQVNLIGIERNAASQFFSQVLGKKDEAFLLMFGEESELLQDYTNSIRLLNEGLSQLRLSAPVGGLGPGPVPTVGQPRGTVLYDAVYLAASEKLKQEVGRKVIVVITDGVDEGSKLPIEEAVEAAIMEIAGEGPFERLVDLGSGTGRMLTLLGDRARSAIGLDLSRQMLNIARSHVAAAGLAACELRHGDVLATGLPAGEADLVVVHQVLHYLAEPAAAVAEAARLIAPGGRVLIVDFAPHCLEFLRAEHRHRRLGFADEEIERCLAGAGLSEISIASLSPTAPGGLTVKIWSAGRAAPRVRKAA